MKAYKGYYIDGVVFNSKQDIDNFLKEWAIKDYKMAVEMFVNCANLANSLWASEKAERLVKYHGFTWEQVEDIEISVMKTIA